MILKRCISQCFAVERFVIKSGPSPIDDVQNVFAIMIINREHKAAIKQIKLCA